MELDEFDPNDPRTRPPSTFELAPVVTQPFPVFGDLHAPVSQSDFPGRHWREDEPDASTRPLPQAPSHRPEVAEPTPAHAAAPVAVSRMQQIGHQAAPTPVPAASPAPHEPFSRTVIAAGHRVPSAVPEARAPVPAYPSEPYEERPPIKWPPLAYQLDAPRELPARPSTLVRPELPLAYDPGAQTTCSDVHGLLGKYPVPLPEFGLRADASHASWSSPATDSDKPALAGQRPPRIERPVSEPRREARARRPTHDDDDELQLRRALSGANVKRAAIWTAVLVMVFGLVGLSVYVKRSRSGEAELAIIPAPEAVTGAPDTAVHTERAAAPSQDAEDEEQVLPSNPKQPEPAEEPAVAKDSQPAAHATPGGVTASSAAALYINGQYKEALAEYRLLARAYPRQRAYSELARILRRKLIETCMRTQPNQREQCKTM